MNEMGGFALLSMPFLILLAIAIVGLIVIAMLIRRAKSRKGRLAVVLVGILMLAAIPTWDIILGRIILSQYCSSSGGIEIYKEVVLGDPYFSDDGSPKYLEQDSYVVTNERGESDSRTSWTVNPEVFRGTYELKTTTEIIAARPVKIEKMVSRLVEIGTGEILAERTVFRYFGGWVANASVGHPQIVQCPGGDAASLPAMYRSVFRRAKP
jgi:hypothetical protein